MVFIRMITPQDFNLRLKSQKPANRLTVRKITRKKSPTLLPAKNVRFSLYSSNVRNKSYKQIEQYDKQHHKKAVRSFDMNDLTIILQTMWHKPQQSKHSVGLISKSTLKDFTGCHRFVSPFLFLADFCELFRYLFDCRIILNDYSDFTAQCKAIKPVLGHCSSQLPLCARFL